MSSLEPRVRAYSGIKYEIYKLSSKISPDKVRDEIKSKQPLYVTYRPKFKAPSLSSINSTVMKEIGSGNFAAVMSGYFYAPLTCEFFFVFFWFIGGIYSSLMIFVKHLDFFHLWTYIFSFGNISIDIEQYRIEQSDFFVSPRILF